MNGRFHSKVPLFFILFLFSNWANDPLAFDNVDPWWNLARIFRKEALSVEIDLLNNVAKLSFDDIPKASPPSLA